MMKLIIGLGNPGKKYELTKHNIGFLTIDTLLNELENVPQKTFTKFNALITEMIIDGEKVLFVKPLTFMNLSGNAVRPIIDWYKIDISNMLVIYDDLDLPTGKIRIREKGSSGGHNGIKSIIQNIGTEQFNRIKIGVDKPERSEVVDHVLSTFKNDEKEIIYNSIKKVCKATLDWVKGEDIKKIMSTYQ